MFIVLSLDVKGGKKSAFCDVLELPSSVWVHKRGKYPLIPLGLDGKGENKLPSLIF